jgi:hypothetical protein
MQIMLLCPLSGAEKCVTCDKISVPQLIASLFICCSDDVSFSDEPHWGIVPLCYVIYFYYYYFISCFTFVMHASLWWFEITLSELHSVIFNVIFVFHNQFSNNCILYCSICIYCSFFSLAVGSNCNPHWIMNLQTKTQWIITSHVCLFY